MTTILRTHGLNKAYQMGGFPRTIKVNALMIGQTAWIIAPIAASVVLFLGLFLTSTGYNQLFAERRGVA